MSDSDIIDLFFGRSEMAIIELSKKYGKICMKVSYSILNNIEDSEECVNDSYLSVWNTVPPQRPNPLLAYLLKIVRNISLNRYDYNSRKKRNNTYDECLYEIEWSLASPDTPENEFNAKLIASSIDEFLETLDDMTQMLFVRRYWYMDSYKDLSKLSSLKEETIRKRLSRTRNSLMHFLEERGIID